MPSQLVVTQKQQPNQAIPSKEQPELKRNETKKYFPSIQYSLEKKT
jgi:hypothetical protein